MSVVDTVTNLLRNPAVGNLFLVLAAIIGVGGNYWLYRRRRSHKRDTLRLALLSELISMQSIIRDLDHQVSIDEMDTVHPEFFFSNNVYDGNSGNLGLLTEEEAVAVVEFYTAAAKVQAVGSRNPGNVFVETVERNLYEKLLAAIEELEQYVDTAQLESRSPNRPLPEAYGGEHGRS